MKKIALILALLTHTFSFSQEFMEKEKFIDSLPLGQKKEIQSKIERKWRSEMTAEDLHCMNYTKSKLSKKVNLTWELHFDYESNVDGFEATIVNNSQKTIKYVNFNVNAYNAVGDVVFDGYKTRKGIGPVESNETGSWTFDNCWLYNSTIDKVRILSISVEYMDRTKLTFNDISDVVIDFDVADKYLELLKKKNAMVDEHIDSIYTSEKQKHDNKIAKILERKKFVYDSIQARIKHAKDSTELVQALADYKKEKDRLTQKIINTDANIFALEELIKDKDKTDFIRTTFGRKPYTDLEKLKSNRTQLRKGQTRPDTTNSERLRSATKNIENAIKEIRYEHIKEYYDPLEGHVPEHTNQMKALYDVEDYAMLDQDFLNLPLKKTMLYQNNKEQYKQKKIDAIEPIEKHVSLLYVYSGGWSPYGVHLAIHPFENISFSAEYVTQGTKENIVDDDPSSYSYSAESISGFFEKINQKNIYNLEDDWDASRQTLTLAMHFPANYKKNILLGFGLGKTITTEHKRYQLPSGYDQFELESTQDFVKYTYGYFPEQDKMGGKFYLDSERRISSNLNYNISATFIFKPLTIKIGVNVSDRDRRDTRINLGLGITL